MSPASPAPHMGTWPDCTPEQALLMAMLAAPSTRLAWGDPVALAARVNWKRFLDLADERIKPYLHWVACQEGFAGLMPEEVIAHLSAKRQATGMRNLRWATVIRALVQAFSAADLPLILVKGSVLQYTIYPTPSIRPMSDIDIIVPESRISDADAILSSLGWKRRVAEGQDLPWLKEVIYTMSFPSGHFMMELHTRPDKPLSDSHIDFWQHRVNQASSLDELALPTFAPEMALRHLCEHLAVEHSFEGGLLWLLDIRLFAEYHRNIDWERLLREADPASLQQLVFTLCLAKEWLGAPIPDNILTGVLKCTRPQADKLAWQQLWDRLPARRRPSRFLIRLLCGDWLGFMHTVLRRRRQWVGGKDHRAPISRGTVFARASTYLRICKATYREGGFRLSTILAARRIHRRYEALNSLFDDTPAQDAESRRPR